DIDAGELADTYSGCVQQFCDRPVPDVEWLSAVCTHHRGVEERARLIDRERVGDGLGWTGGCKTQRGVVLGHAFTLSPRKEGAHCRPTASKGRATQSRRRLCGEPCAQVGESDIAPRGIVVKF